MVKTGVYKNKDGFFRIKLNSGKNEWWMQNTDILTLSSPICKKELTFKCINVAKKYQKFFQELNENLHEENLVCPITPNYDENWHEVND